MITQHTVRPVETLGGLWDFCFLDNIDPDSFDPRAPFVAEKLPVPCAFDALPAYASKRGCAVYQTVVTIPAGRAAWLEFGAVSIWCRIFIDGEPVAEHRCGYSPFVVEMAPASVSKRLITVLVDNRFDASRTPMHDPRFDFYQYGGILRPVRLHILPESGQALASVQVTPLEHYQSGEVQVRVRLSGAGSPPPLLAFQFDDHPAENHHLHFRDGVASLSLTVPDPRLWSPSSPHLHRLSVTLHDRNGEACDDLAVRFGLRHIEVCEGQLSLNGTPLTLLGYNRHEWAPDSGPCTSTIQMAADLQLLRNLGCNFVRGAHYPQDSRFLELCDEYGILVWEENLGWQQDHRVLADPAYQRDHQQALGEMIERTYNHPCVIMRGFLNEAESDHPAARALYESASAMLRERDPSRLVSYATDRPGRNMPDLCLDLCDVVSLNLYPGWYGCEEESSPLDLIGPRIREAFEAVKDAGHGDKPILVSEIGAEALYGCRDAHRDFFSEQYQADYLRTACQVALALPGCCGIALWQFTDIRTYGGGRALLRPRTFNNKGSLDEYRRPKLAYETVRALFCAQAQHTARQAAFSLVELMVVVAVIAVLGLLTFPLSRQMMQHARQTQCASNLRQIGTGLFAYAADNGGRLPPASGSYPPSDQMDSWAGAVWTYVGYTWRQYRFKENDPRLFGDGPFQPNVFRCPSTSRESIPVPSVGDVNSNHFSYGFNISPLASQGYGGQDKWTNPIVLATIVAPSQTAMVTEDSFSRGDWWGYLTYYGLIPHNEGSNVLFFDGHVQWMALSDFPTMESDVFWSGH